MVENRKEKIILGTILLMVIHAILFGVYGFTNPIATNFLLFGNKIQAVGYYIDLPFCISRWFDIIIWPLFVCLVESFLGLCKKVTFENEKEKSDFVSSLKTGFVVGLMFGLPSAFLTGLEIGLFGFVPLLLFDFIYIVCGYTPPFLSSLSSFCLSFGLSLGFSFGLASGLVSGLMVVVSFGLISVLVWLVKNIFSPAFWEKIWDFMVVEDE